MNRPTIRPFSAPKSMDTIPFGSTFESGHLVEGNAGWRTFKPEVNQEECTLCLKCYMLCPDGVIFKENDQLVIDYDFCKGCGICANECKFKAITMVKEEI